MKLSKSKDHNPNYLATICKIGEVHPIEGADRLVRTVINGYDIIISKEMAAASNEPVVYFPCETAIAHKYLSANNLYAIECYNLNSNAEEVQKVIETDKDKAKSMVGFFSKQRRVRILKLRGEYSQGFLAGTDTLRCMMKNPNEQVDWNALVGEQFDEIDGELLCEKYIPAVKQSNQHGSQHQYNRCMKKLNRFDRIIPEEFKFHFDTTMLAEHIKEISPEAIVNISVKVHGTSTIHGNVLVNRRLKWYEKIKKFFGFNVPTTEYGNVYSSRTVIKNRYINNNVTPGFYGVDIWGCVNRDFADALAPGMTVYGEIVGYLEGSQTMIQKNHDYGCKPGQWKFMPYRIVTKQSDGTVKEWTVDEVWEWTANLKYTYSLDPDRKQLAEKLMLINILYHGKFCDLYPDIPIDEHWHENVLARLKCDFEMEKQEPMCRLKAPREGIVIRIDNDKFPRAWKLKSKAHYSLEAKQHDTGDADIEETA